MRCWFILESLVFIIATRAQNNITCNQDSVNEICNIECIKPYSCSNSIIYCKKETCNVVCNDTKSCYNSTIVLSHPLTLNVSCTNDLNACNTLIINSSTTAHINVECIQNNTCNKMVIHGSNNDVIQLSCDQNSSCENIWINATHSKNVYIDCIGLYSCSQLILYAPQWDYIQCENDYSCVNLVLYTMDGVDNPHSNNYLNCAPQDSTVCLNATAYCNPGFESNCVFEYEYNSTLKTGQWHCEGLCGGW
eukprot:99312_1